MAQFARPIADLAAASWTTSPLWSKVEEGPTGDGVWITSDAVGNNSDTTIAILDLGTVSDPGVSTGHVIRVKWRGNVSGRSIVGRVALRQGTTVIATFTSTAPGTDTTGVTSTYTLSGAEADAITDYGDLNFQIWGFGNGGGPSRSLEVDYVELEVPDAAPPPTLGQLEGGSRHAVSAPDGTPYYVDCDSSTGAIRVFKGDAYAATNFTEQDTANNPTNANYRAPSACIDGDGVIRILYLDWGSSTSAIRYCEFNTGTDSFQNDAEAFASVGTPTVIGTAIAYDPKNRRVVASWVEDASGFDTVYYAARTGTWSSKIEVEGATASKQCHFPSITLSERAYPFIAYVNETDSTLTVADGGAETPSSFTLTDRDTSVSTIEGTQKTSILRKHNVTWVAAVDSDGSIIAYENGTARDTGVSGKTPSLFQFQNGDVGVIYEDANDDVAYSRWNGASWESSEVLETGTFTFPEAVEHAIRMDAYNDFSQITADQLWALNAPGDYHDRVGQSFTGDGQKIGRVRIVIRSYDASGGGYADGTYYQCKVFAHSGTFGTSSVPTGSSLADSEQIEEDFFPFVNGIRHWFEFRFLTPYQTVNGTKYCFDVNTNDSTLGSSVPYDDISPTHGGNFYRVDGGTPNAQSGRDIVFEVWSESKPQFLSDSGSGLTWGQIEAVSTEKKLSGTIGATSSVTGNLKSYDKLSGTPAGAGAASGVLMIVRDLSGAPAGVGAASGTLSLEKPLGGSPAGIATASGTLSLTKFLAATVTGAGTVSGNVISRDDLAGVISNAATVTGDLKSVDHLSGTAAGIATVDGQLSTGELIELSGSAAGVGSASGDALSIDVLAGTAEGVGAVSGDLKTYDKLSGSIGGVSTVSGDLLSADELTGLCAGVASVSGEILTIDHLSGTIDGTGVVSGELESYDLLAGTIDSEAAVSGDLRSYDLLSGSIAGEGTTSGEVKSYDLLDGTPNGDATVTGNLSVGNEVLLSGAANGVGVPSGSLSITVKLQRTIAASAVVSGNVLSIDEVGGTVSGACTASGDLRSYDKLSGTAESSSTASGDLRSYDKLAGTPAGVGSSSGVAVLTLKMGAVIACSSSASGTLTTEGSLSGTVPGAAVVSGTLAVEKPLAGVVAGSAIADGQLSIVGTVTLDGQADGAGAVSGSFTQTVNFTGTIVCSGVHSGELTDGEYLSGTAACGAVVTGGIITLESLSGVVANAAGVSGQLKSIDLLSSTINGGSAASGELKTIDQLGATVASPASASGSLKIYDLLAGNIGGESESRGSLFEFVRAIPPLRLEILDSGETRIRVLDNGSTDAFPIDNGHTGARLN